MTAPAARESDVERSGIPGGALGLARVMIAFLFFVLLDAAVELIDEQVDGGVHVFFGGDRVDDITTHVQRCFGLLAQLLFYGEHTMNVDDLIEVPCDAFEL